MLCQRRCRRRENEEAENQAAEIIRVSLRNLNWLGGLEADESRNANVTDHNGGLSQEDRREFIKNVLVSRVSSIVSCGKRLRMEWSGVP
jgi:hypothetical protein